MLEHLKDHSDVKEPGVSCECGKTFRNKYFMRRHVKRMHVQDGQIHECPHCQKQFQKIGALKSHIAYNHNFKIYKCEVCEKVCKKAKDLKVSDAPRSNRVSSSRLVLIIFFGAGTHGNTHWSGFVSMRVLPEIVQS